MSDIAIADLVDIEIGADGDFAVSAGGDMNQIEGTASFEQDIRSLIITVPGTAPWDEEGEYGIGLVLYLGGGISSNFLGAISDRIKEQLANDDRVKADSTSVVFNQLPDETLELSVGAISAADNSRLRITVGA